MTIKSIVILGAGPCGLSSAIALSRMSALRPCAIPLHITVVEVRPKFLALGGTINMTPLAMRYLDYLGAGMQLRENSIGLDAGVDSISLRTGRRLGNIWGGIGARRTARHQLVRSLLDVIDREHSNSVQIQWGKQVTNISEVDDQVQLSFEDQSVLQSDIALGCDGIHSATRRIWVEPTREKRYTGRAVSMGWVRGATDQGDKAASKSITLVNGERALRDTAAFNATKGVLIASFFEPSRKEIFFAHVRKMTEQKSALQDGWCLSGKDQEQVQKDVVEAYGEGRVNGLRKSIASCDNWQVYPIYSLPPGGRWHRGRVLLLGDAAHAMPPQGESTGIAIEDGVLIAKVLGRHANRSVGQLFSDYESVRRGAIDKHYQDSEKMGRMISSRQSVIMGMVMDAVTMVLMFVKKRQQIDHFKGDVRDMDLPE